MDGVDDVECVGAGSVEVGLRGGSGGSRLGEDEVVRSGRLGGDGGLRAFEGDGVVTTIILSVQLYIGRLVLVLTQ